MVTDIKFPLYSPGKYSENNESFAMLVADVRKERSFFALYKISHGKLISEVERNYESKDFSSFSQMAKVFKSETSAEFTVVSVAVPGPVINGKCETENLPWTVDAESIKAELNVEKVSIVNDMEATAYSLSDLSSAEIIPIHESQSLNIGNVAILAPGNGLGEAGLFWDGEFLRPFATEGGHTEFSPRNDFEVGFYHFLNKIYGIVSWEHVLSKGGLYNIYRYLRDVGQHTEDAGLAKKIQEGNIVDSLVEAGKNENSRLAKLTLELFAEFLAREANCLALKLKATGGLVITGEICEAIRAFIDKDKFYSDFKISDKMESLLKNIPIYFVFNSRAILHGAAYYGVFKK